MTNDFMDNQQFVVSYELLQLLEWLSQYEHEALKKMIHRAFQHGLGHELTIHARKTARDKEHSGERMKQNVVDFFSLLEILMSEIMQEKETSHVLTKSMISAIDKVDTRMYDPASIERSVAKACSAPKKTGENPHEVLYKELLKRWKPAKKAFLN